MFKTSDEKNDLVRINSDISGMKSTMCYSIKRWFETTAIDTLGLSRFGLYDKGYKPESLEDTISYANFDELRKSDKDNADQYEKLLLDIEAGIDKPEFDIKKKKQEIENAKLECVRKISSLAGKDVDIDRVYVSDLYENNLYNLSNKSVANKELEVVHSVQVEAQKQADTKEAELKNISLDELLKMKEMALAEKENSIDDSPSMR